MESYNKLLQNNKEWVAETLKLDPNFFDELAKGQNPEFLWIGCADSRVPANQITGTKPGDVFVHRNIANMVVNTDINMLSVLQYAVDVLKVKHIIVCGHYGCGGVAASMNHKDHGLVGKWLTNIREVYAKNANELNAITDEHKRTDRLVELNAVQQVKNLSKTAIVQRAWHRGQALHLHGWVYGLDSGLIKDMDVNISTPEQVEEPFRLEF